MSVEVIGRALVEAAGGVDFRRIAAELGLPESTVRNWLRRARALAERIREHFTCWGFALDPALAGGGAAGGGGGLVAAVEAVGRCTRVAAVRLGRRSPWGAGEFTVGRPIVVHERALDRAAVSGDPARRCGVVADGALMDADRRRDVALFRYSLVRNLAMMRPEARGRAVRELAAREHLTPWGRGSRSRG